MAGARSRERRLEIMRDSRIGAHGALALLLATGLRAAAIAPVMYLLPPARPDGLSHAAGRPDRGRAADAVAIGVLLCALALAPVADPVRIILAMAGAAAGASLPALLARRRLGGQTGDVLGAVQQCAEIGFLLVFIADP
jgi:adenosylcobinamide-GDP ribazoletransferase